MSGNQAEHGVIGPAGGSMHSAPVGGAGPAHGGPAGRNGGNGTAIGKFTLTISL